jgi:hypothetical protein
LKRAAALIAVALLSAWAAHAQRLAVLQPSDEAAVPGLADELRSGLTARARLVDTDLAFAAFRSVAVAEPFNMSADEARRVGSVIGCDRFVILRSALQRRAGAQGRSYFEAYSATYLIDARSGLLIRFDLTSAEAPAEAEAAAGLLAKIHGLSAAIANAKFEPQKTVRTSPSRPPKIPPRPTG